jgi:hypothetical protein
MKIKKFVLLMIIVLSMLIVHPVSAYWDAGTLTMLWQAIAALALAILIVLKTKWYQLKQFFSKLKRS